MILVKHVLIFGLRARIHTVKGHPTADQWAVSRNSESRPNVSARILFYIFTFQNYQTKNVVVFIGCRVLRQCKRQVLLGLWYYIFFFFLICLDVSLFFESSWIIRNKLIMYEVNKRVDKKNNWFVIWTDSDCNYYYYIILRLF